MALEVDFRSLLSVLRFAHIASARHPGKIQKQLNPRRPASQTTKAAPRYLRPETTKPSITMSLGFGGFDSAMLLLQVFLDAEGTFRWHKHWTHVSCFCSDLISPSDRKPPSCSSPRTKSFQDQNAATRLPIRRGRSACHYDRCMNSLASFEKWILFRQ